MKHVLVLCNIGLIFASAQTTWKFPRIPPSALPYLPMSCTQHNYVKYNNKITCALWCQINQCDMFGVTEEVCYLCSEDRTIVVGPSEKYPIKEMYASK